MTALFGYSIEPDFDLALEQRRDRLWWLLLGGTALCLLYLFTGRPFATELFQGWLATSLFFGDNFYVRRRRDLRQVVVMEGDSNNRTNPRALFGRHILVGPGQSPS